MNRDAQENRCSKFLSEMCKMQRIALHHIVNKPFHCSIALKLPMNQIWQLMDIMGCPHKNKLEQ